MLSNISYYFDIVEDIFLEAVSYITSTDYLMVLLCLGLIVVAFEVFGSARWAVGAFSPNSHRGV